MKVSDINLDFKSIDKKLEKIYLKILKKVKNIYESTGIQYPILVIKTMEEIERLKNIKNENRLKIAIKCLTEIIKDSDIDNGLIKTIPSTIETVIKLSKKKPINKNIKGLNIVRSISITETALEKIIEKLKKENYDLNKILENGFSILSDIMCIVGKYHCLSNSQKKEIAMDIMKYIIVEFKKCVKDDTDIELDDFKLDDNENLLIKSVFETIPDMIDTIVDVNENKFNINKSAASLCFACMA